MRHSAAKDLAQALFEEAGDALFLFDPENDQVQDVNPLAERLSGFTRAEMVQFQATYLFRFTGQGGRNRLQQAAARTTQFHAQDGFLLRTRQDGVWVPVNLSVTRLHLQPRTLALITARDMREQHEAHQKLQRMEAELRRVLASVSDCLWSAEWTQDGRWTYHYLSPVVERLTGRAAAHFLAGLLRWQEVVHHDDRAGWSQARRRLLGGQGGQSEYRVVWPDGTTRWLRESVEVTRKPDGVTLRLDGVLSDVTDRRHHEEALREERRLLRTLMDNLPEAIYFKDAQGRYLVDNAAHRLILGAASEDDVRGRTIFDFFPAEAAQKYADDDRVVLQGGRLVQDREEVIVDPQTGLPRYHSYTKVPLHDGDGQVRGLVCIGRDVTRQRDAERALAHERHLLRILTDTLPDHIFVKDAHSRFVIANAATVRSLGARSMAEVLGKTDFDFLPLERAEQFFADEQRVVRTGQALLDREELLIDAAGNARWLLTTKVPLRGEGDAVIGLVGVSHDITSRRTLEEEVRRARDVAEAASKAKSDFLARMSHEIRTPMNGILGMTEVALDTNLTDEQRECLQMVLASGEALLAIINDVLDFSKIEAGKLQLEPAPFHLRDGLADAVRSLGLRAQQKGLELACHVAPDVPDLLVGDAGRLRQVIVNLVGNAIKFTERGEVIVWVELQIADCRLQIEKTADASASASSSVNLQSAICNLQFSVLDTGIGIPREKHQAIFEPFEQVDGTTTRKHGGTGLGLAISAQLVQLMGGRMWVDSVPGEGSRFHFTARFDIVAGHEDSHGPVEPPELVGLRVLLVDDNARHRAILAEMFANWRMCPTAVGSVAEALAELRRAAAAGEPYALQLVDAVMPPPDGFRLAEAARAEPGLVGTTVMMLTSAGWASGADRCREHGVTGSVLKPLKQSELLDTVLAAVSAGTARRGGRRDRGRDAPRLPPLRVLLAEDNVVNQRLALRILQKAGHSVHVANNGREAIEVLKRQPFDVVLMDVQMPVMGGFEATALIRDAERGTGTHLPIVALTAHAMKGDRERCLAAGMDTYVSKPIREAELFAAVEQALRAHAADVLARPVAPPPTSPPQPMEARMAEDFERAAALERCGGDDALLSELIDMFLDGVAEWMSELSLAIVAGDARAVQRTAHMIKGTVGTFGKGKEDPGPTWQAAERLEEMGRDGNLAEVAPAWEELRVAVERLKGTLAEFRR